MTEETPRPATADETAHKLTIAIVGGRLRAASILRLLSEIDSVQVAAVACSTRSSPAIRLAEELGIYVTDDISEVFQIRGLDLIVDMSEDPMTHAMLEAQKPEGVETFGLAGSELLWDLLVARKRGEEHEKLFVELQVAYDRIRSHEHRLQASKDALERANSELESRLVELFFTHEFCKALTAIDTVDDVCALIVDGVNGILAAEISCVYLFDREDRILRLRASQGRPPDSFEPVVAVSETILGDAFRQGVTEHRDVEFGGTAGGWVCDPSDVRSQAAVPLRTGDRVIGILVIASSTYREFSDTDIERLQVIAAQSALSLHNVLPGEEPERSTVTDGLTGLRTHGYFHERFEEEILRASRFGRPLTLLLLDVDSLGDSSDAHGHAAAGTVLRAVAGIISRNLRETDIAARMRGGELAVALPETDAEEAIEMAEAIREGVEGSVLEIPGAVLPVKASLSIAVAAFPSHGDSLSLLVDAAGKAMYDAKRNGKNEIRVAP